MPSLQFTSKGVQAKASQAEDLNLLAEDSMWASQRGEIYGAFEELMALVAERRKRATSA